VRLPLDDTAPPEETSIEHAPLSTGVGARRVLIVDDNQDACQLLALMLEQRGYETSVAEDGPTALEGARAFRPHIVILDIGLPGMSGYEVAAALRRMPNLSNTAIIAVSGWGSPEDKRRAMEAGFDVHLTKPVFAEELGRALEAMHPAKRNLPRETLRSPRL
jgi:CheY-like chemotaxis protein